MATTPGILTDWPWKNLGSFKYGILAPFVVHSIYSFVTKDATQRDLTNFLLASLFLSRMVHNQIWISLSRYQTAKGKNRILDKSIEFDQVDRERDWDDQIIFNALLFYVANLTLEGASHIPIWRTDGIIITFLCHIGAVEFLYYWFHRALHHHFLYSRYHSHHHSSIVTEPITSVIHPFAEHLVYSMLFAIPLMVITFTKTGSIFAFGGYVTMVDFMNNLGHCNFELIPKKLFTIFPPLKYIIYTPSFHSLHHTQFRTNYSLFMPFYDYIYGTMDKSSDTLYETSLLRNVDTPDVVHLTHLTTAESIYHLRLGFASLASKPQAQDQWYLWLMWPLTIWSVLVTWFLGQTFVLERNSFKHLRLQTWALPKYKIQYLMPSQRESINSLIEEAILEAEERGIKVFSLGLLNQGEELNRSGDLFVKRNPSLKVKLVDGSSLAVAVVLNTIPKGTTQVVLRGNLNKEAYSIALALCQRDIKVVIPREDDFARVKTRFGNTGIRNDNLIFSKSFMQKIWVVGDGLTQEDQSSAQKGTCFIPFSRFPPKKMREDCFYCLTPAFLTPETLENVDSCENWLPRRVMSAWRVAGIVHALEGWDVHECGNTLFDVDKIWQATLHHGFLPLLN